jgi:biotin carboxyl carrier protein
MKKYNIIVNGNKYEVEVDEIGGAPGVVQIQAPVDPVAPAPAAAPAPASAPAAAPAAGAQIVESPMPGTILDILKKAGETVADGEVVLILEAMKMENEIVAPHAGTIDAVVAKGTAVNAGDMLFSMR